MCGIITYWGTQKALPVLLTGLNRLEYRGYDSSGLALIGADGFTVYKAAGKIKNLEAELHKAEEQNRRVDHRVGLAHTRWATHGEATAVNAHPHISLDGDLVGVHNGTIENYLTLKAQLEKNGYSFKSATDTEILINFISWIRESQKLDLAQALPVALREISGTCALVIYSRSEKRLAAVNKGGNLCGSASNGNYFIASDNKAFVGETENFFNIEDGQIVILEDGKGLQLLNMDFEKLTPILQAIDTDIRELEKGDFPTFMLKEIFSQPQIVREALAGRVDFTKGEFIFGGLNSHWEKIRKAESLTIIACGTSWHAGFLAKEWIEKLVGIPVRVEYASEFQEVVVRAGEIVIGISQSGETRDTLIALKAARARGAMILGICNVVGSAMTRVTDAGIYTRAGVENGVASTKAFTAQAVALLLFTLKLAADRQTVPRPEFRKILEDLERLPDLMDAVIKNNDAPMKILAEKFRKTKNCLFLGRGYNFPIALEGALKLKEISYVHAEGMSAGEMKHGPIALIDAKMPVIVSATRDSTYGKIINNLSEIKARHGKLIVIINDGDNEAAKLADELITIPIAHETIAPLLNLIPLQLFAHYSAMTRGCDVDRPRNLAKAVTVE